MTEASFAFATLGGHPLPGIVRFSADDLADGTVRFAITIVARAATMVDWVAMKTVGRGMQDENWRAVVAGVVTMSGGMAIEIESDRQTLSAEDATSAEAEVEEMIAATKRNRSE